MRRGVWYRESFQGSLRGWKRGGMEWNGVERSARRCLEDKARSSDGCVRASGTTSNVFRWYGRSRLVEVEHVFDAQGGLHIVGLLVGGSRKITSGALGWTQLSPWQRTKLKSSDAKFRGAATEQEGRRIPSVLAYGFSRISKTELNTTRGHREFPPHQPHPRNPRHPIAPQPVPYPSAKRHGSHGGSYGINKSGAHAPQLPLLLPSATTSHPFASSSLRPTTVHHICLLCTPTNACAYTLGMAFARADWCLSSYYKFMAVGEVQTWINRVKEIVMVRYLSKDAERRTEAQRGVEGKGDKREATEAMTRGSRAHDGGSISKMAATEAAASTSRVAAITLNQMFFEVEV
ncbi:hypothetical protein ALC53_10708 [Atta colombica]|uniref:Uncharacterized protein n=1 Tax=Atta colombica TaxID=520822 RepID=A0A151HZV8_9HYME|nr:hypothetical protein ALC53_10708 [Atta colombica]